MVQLVLKVSETRYCGFLFECSQKQQVQGQDMPTPIPNNHLDSTRKLRTSITEFKVPVVRIGGKQPELSRRLKATGDNTSAG
jgi:hypothetical protein